MAEFTYIAVGKDRSRSQGMMKARDMDAAVKQLEEDGNTIISLKPVESAKFNSDSSLGARTELFVKKMLRHIPPDILIFFTRQLSTMVDAGMTLERAFYMLSKDQSHPRFKKIISQCNQDIKKGMALSEALGKHPEAFSTLYTGLVRAGETGGMLPKILGDLADYQEKSHDTRRKVMSALYYPVFVLVFLLICVAVLVLKVAPMFNNIYKNFGADLPLPTTILMNISNAFINNLSVGILIFLSCGVGLLFFSQTHTGAFLIDRLKLRLPVFGMLIHDSMLARFSRTLSLLIASGTAMQDALRLSSGTLTNKVLEKSVGLIEQGIRQGRSMSQVMEETAVFPSMLTGIVATGEETGELDALLIKSAEFFEKQVEALITRITSLIEPLLILLLGTVVGAIVIIIYLPIFYLGLAIKQGLN